MTKGSNVTEDQCEDRMDKVFQKVDETHKLIGALALDIAVIKGQRSVFKWLTPVVIAIVGLIISIISIQGCGRMPHKAKKTSHLKAVSNVDTIEEYAELKREITQRVRTYGINFVFPVTGSRNYILEADGTLMMQCAGEKRGTNTWKRFHWNLFKDDCRNGLWRKLEHIAEALNPQLPMD